MDYQKCYDTILKTIMPQSFPIGVKIIKKDEPFPEKAVRPAKVQDQDIAMPVDHNCKEMGDGPWA